MPNLHTNNNKILNKMNHTNNHTPQNDTPQNDYDMWEDDDILEMAAAYLQREKEMEAQNAEALAYMDRGANTL